MIITCSVFVVVDIVLFEMFIAALINAFAAILALSTLIYFKKTDNYKPAAYISVATLILTLTSFFAVTGNQHYGFYWLCIMPPITFILLERRPARIVTAAFSVYVLIFILINSSSWSPAAFDTQSLFNITGATVCIIALMAYYEKSRNEAWAALNGTILELVDSKDDLRLILDSAAEAIYGTDTKGNCMFCNQSCIDILGYSDESELLGKNMHWQVHHTRRDGTPFPIDECKIIQSLINCEGSHVDDEVFWRADGTSFDVEYYSYPQIKNGVLTGAVVTFTDISERKQKEAEIQFLSCYDILTGLQNRRCFEENLERIDNPENLPLSVIFADINGLKMTNDIFGHIAGDELIKKSAEILRSSCRAEDIVARIGGDEFVIVLPKTTKDDAEKTLERIKAGFKNVTVRAIKGSISLGIDTKDNPGQLFEEIMANAENAMYKDKTMNRTSINKDIIDTTIQALHSTNSREKQHSVNVSEMCADLGVALQLAETKINKLKRAGYLHDIGKIVLDESILTKEDLTDEDRAQIQQHPAVGYRILTLFDDTLDLAEYVYGHHERWDGAGYPRGLKGEQISQLSRIIAIAETFDRVVNRGDLPWIERKQAALNVLKNGSGTQFDPQIAELFIRMMETDEGAES